MTESYVFKINCKYSGEVENIFLGKYPPMERKKERQIKKKARIYVLARFLEYKTRKESSCHDYLCCLSLLVSTPLTHNFANSGNFI